jgi:hypothetical protein
VQYGVEVLLGEKRLESLPVSEVCLQKVDPSTGDALHCVERTPRAVLKAIDDRDVMAGLQQLDAHVAADIARAARD